MHFIAANATGKPAIVLRGGGRRDSRRAERCCSFVEDLNWPVPTPPQKKQRPVEVWAPGPLGSWEGEVPSVQ